MNVVNGGVSAVLAHTTFDNVCFDSRVQLEFNMCINEMPQNSQNSWASIIIMQLVGI